jgi:hypothetical protein
MQECPRLGPLLLLLLVCIAPSRADKTRRRCKLHFPQRLLRLLLLLLLYC